MRILTGALFTETNISSPIPTGWAAFREFVLDRPNPDLKPSIAAEPLLLWEALAKEDGHELVHCIAAAATPAGRTTRAVYEALRDEILEVALRRGPFDMALLLLHGAMAAEGYDDCEGDLLARLRDILGPDAVIGAELDLHCGISEAMLANATLLVTFKEYPHVDVLDRARDLYRLCMKAARGDIEPVPVLKDCRMSGLYFTQNEPLRGFVDGMTAREEGGQILSVSLAHGFPWGAAGTTGTKLLVYADGDRATAEAVACEMVDQLRELRDAISFRGTLIDDAFEHAAGRRGPIVMADTADNPGIGAPGDSTFVLQHILDHGVRNAIVAPIWDPGAVNLCREAGMGAVLDLRIGGKLGAASGDPLDVRLVVRSLCDELSTPGLGEASLSYGAAALIEIEGAGVRVVLCSKRNQAFHPELFTRLGVDLGEVHVAVVKSFNHFQAAFQQVATEIIHLASPGAGAIRPMPSDRSSLSE